MSKILVRQVLLALLLLFAGVAKSQSPDLVLKVADDLFENEDYFGAIQFYEKAIAIDSNNAEVLYKYARNLSMINQHKKSSRYYQKALILDGSNEFPMAAYYLAESYRYSGDYRKARRYYNQALRPFRSDRKSYWYQRMDQNKDAASWASKNDGFKLAEPANLTKKVNSSFAEFAPTIHNSRIFFSAMLADSVGENNTVKDKYFYTRIYYKSLTSNEEAKKIEMTNELSNKFKNLHLANPAFYENNIYFSVCDSNFICSIWEGQLVDNKIVSANKLNKNINYPSSNNTQASPVKINDEVYLFFASDRPGGLGDLDIYIAKKVSFGFDQAINLGPTVNSLGNEITPFYDVFSQTLFFSSDWHIGYGGYDIFKSTGLPVDFKESENIGFGINSSADDYYFKAFESIALLASNRNEGSETNKSDCCNDLYEVNYKADSVKNNTDEVLEETVNIEVLNKFLPTELYFHNDEPNPNSRKMETEKNYMDLAVNYVKMKDDYLTNYINHVSRRDKSQAKVDLEYFFENRLQQGISQLEEFTPLLLKELQKGSKIELAVRGFASSISETEYNLKLTYRRIESLINYFKEAENGAFMPFLNDEAENGGFLTFNKIPYGEYAVTQSIDEEDKIEAIYSPQAASERKIELIAVSSSSNSSSISMEEPAKIKFNSTLYELGPQENKKIISRFFKVKNTGKGDLKLYNISPNCDCVNLDYPTLIPAGDESKILVEIDLENLTGRVNIELLVVSNTTPNLNRLSIKFELE
ncbi:MAG: DUF1573 domain-containing protein [Vicingaceae bacterium]